MTKRMIDSAIWTNIKFSEMPYQARLLMLGIATTADDQGRIQAHPGILKGALFAFDDDIKSTDIQKWLEIIQKTGTIILYKNDDGEQFAQLRNWWKFQSLQYAMPSKFPKPEGWQDRIRYNFTKGVILTCNWLLTDGTPTENTCDEHGTPIPNSNSIDFTETPDNDKSNQVDNQVDNQVEIQEEEEEDKDKRFAQSLAPAPSKKSKTTKSKKTTDPRIKEIIDTFSELRNKGVNYAQEAAFAKKIANQFGAENYTELVRGTYLWLKADEFWRFKPVGLATIFKNIEEFKRWRDKESTLAKKKETKFASQAEPAIDPNFVGRMNLPRVGYWSSQANLENQ